MKSQKLEEATIRALRDELTTSKNKRLKENKKLLEDENTDEEIRKIARVVYVLEEQLQYALFPENDGEYDNAVVAYQSAYLWGFTNKFFKQQLNQVKILKQVEGYGDYLELFDYMKDFLIRDDETYYYFNKSDWKNAIDKVINSWNRKADGMLQSKGLSVTITYAFTTYSMDMAEIHYDGDNEDCKTWVESLNTVDNQGYKTVDSQICFDLLGIKGIYENKKLMENISNNEELNKICNTICDIDGKLMNEFVNMSVSEDELTICMALKYAFENSYTDRGYNEFTTDIPVRKYIRKYTMYNQSADLWEEFPILEKYISETNDATNFLDIIKVNESIDEEVEKWEDYAKECISEANIPITLRFDVTPDYYIVMSEIHYTGNNSDNKEWVESKNSSNYSNEIDIQSFYDEIDRNDTPWNQ